MNMNKYATTPIRLAALILHSPPFSDSCATRALTAQFIKSSPLICDAVGFQSVIML